MKRHVRRIILGIVCMSLPVVGYRVSEWRTRRLHLAVASQARQDLEHFNSKYRKLIDDHLFSGKPFARWLPKRDVQGRPIPRPGAGAPMIIVFAGKQKGRIEPRDWNRLITDHPSLLVCWVIAIRTTDVTPRAREFSHPRRYLVADPRGNLHLKFHARNRMFVLNRSGRVIFDEEGNSKCSVSTGISSAVVKALAGGVAG